MAPVIAPRDDYSILKLILDPAGPIVFYDGK